MAPESSIGDLPDEILLMILSSLPTAEDVIRCSMVCRRWQRLTTEGTLWKSAKISEFTVIPLKSLAKLIQRGICSFDLSKAVIEDPDSWSRIFPPPMYKSEMTFLDLTEVGISSKSLECLLRPMNELRELRLGLCTGRLDRCCCEAIAKNTHLRTLDLHGCRNIDISGIEKILVRCQRLENLILSETRFRRHGLLVISRSLPASLLRLDLRDVGLFFDDSHLKNVVKLCPKLTHLDVSGTNRVSHAAVEKANASLDLEELAYEPDSEYSDYDDNSEESFESVDSDSSLSCSSAGEDSNEMPFSLLLNENAFDSSSSDSSFNLNINLKKRL